MKVYYDADCDINLITNKKIVVLGYGSQGSFTRWFEAQLRQIPSVWRQQHIGKN